MRKSSKIVEIPVESPIEASQPPPRRSSISAADARRTSAAGVSDARRPSISREEVVVEANAPSVASARAMFLAKSAAKEDPKAKVTRRTSVAVMSAPAVQPATSPTKAFAPAASNRLTIAIPAQPEPVSPSKPEKRPSTVIEESPLPSMGKAKAFMEKFVPPSSSPSQESKAARSATVGNPMRLGRQATVATSSAAARPLSSAKSRDSIMAPAPAVQDATPKFVPVQTHTAPSAATRQPSSGNVIVEASELPAANKAKAFQEKPSATHVQDDATAMRLARSATIGSRPKSVVVKGNQMGCGVCNQPVFQMEKLEADGVTYHKRCFRCAVCNKAVSLSGFAALEGKVYCKPHFKQLFALKGNYNEGFGTEQHKNKWNHSSGNTDV